MKNILLIIGLFLLAPQIHAMKFRTYSLAELVESADAIVIARINVRDGAIRANIHRSLKGHAGTDVVVDSFSVRTEDKASFNNGETAILFLQKEENGRRLLVGYGEQGKWPKTIDKWPYSAVHVVTIKKVEEAIEMLLKLNSKTLDEKVEKIKSLLSSKDMFDQSCALEYLDACQDQKLKDSVLSEVNALRGSSKNQYLHALCDSVNQTNRHSHFP
ncbi:MAG: hypothetical protein PHV34_15895 [Verrucomicrobiae bacterium]|nr:hypothetical protein [Verrucomicrobiae bacterium]